MDTICSLPESLPDVDTTTTLLTGSSDGIVRAVQLFPTKLLGVVADHGEWPIEKVAVGEGSSYLSLDQDEAEDSEKSTSHISKRSKEDEDGEDEDDHVSGEDRWWVGSVGHDEMLRLSNLRSFFRTDQPHAQEADIRVEQDSSADIEDAEANENVPNFEEQEEHDTEKDGHDGREDSEDSDGGSDDSDSDSAPESQAKKRRMKPEKNPLAAKRKKGRNDVQVEGKFFDEL